MRYQQYFNYTNYFYTNNQFLIPKINNEKKIIKIQKQNKF